MCCFSFEARHQIHKQKGQYGDCGALEGTEDQDSGGTKFQKEDGSVLERDGGGQCAAVWIY